LVFSRELAELLGQVKPPTVTKEDIDKSGLEIIKAPQVEQYEKDGKISSNCTERVCSLLRRYNVFILINGFPVVPYLPG
jgi:hypothetical protein